MKILHTTAEYFPFIKSGGLSDMLSSLTIEQAKSDEVFVALPYISSIKEKIEFTGVVYNCIPSEDLKSSIASQILGRSKFKEAVWSGVKLYFFDSELFTPLQSIYANHNEHYNFAIFSYACYHLSKVLSVDIVHSHDWHTALVTVLSKTSKPNKPTCFTIHNLAYQGDHGAEVCGFLRADPFYLNLDYLYNVNRVNYMKGALLYTDQITTVSPGYRDEVLNEPSGNSLSWLLREKEAVFRGILNGINTNEWNPEVDNKIYSNYNFLTHKTGKEKNKIELYKEFGLDVELERPLVGIVSRLSFQKGFNTFLNSFYQKWHLPFYYFILGTGEENLENAFFYESHHNHRRLFFYKGFNESTARKIEAASDFFLMPSLFEPCGLNQLYSHAYGAIPIVSRVGGLKDSVNESWDKKELTGFIFEAGMDHSLNYALERASQYYNAKEDFYFTREKIMQLDWSWKKGAGEYKEVYQDAISNFKSFLPLEDLE